MRSCNKCPVNTASGAKQSSCTPCPSGQISKAGAASCSPAKRLS